MNSVNTKVYKSYSSVSGNRTETGAIFGIEAIKQDILNLAMTRKGAFPGDNDRGLLINDYIFHPTLTSYDENLIIDDAREQFQSDPRFNINEIYLLTDDETHTLIMMMNIRVFPFNKDIELTIPFRNE